MDANFPLRRPIVFFDLETTGLDIAKDRVLEISCLKIFPDGREETYSRLVNPQVPIPAEAAAVHGITADMVAQEPVFAELAHEILAIFEGCDIGGYNCNNFDVPMLKAEFARCGMVFPQHPAHVVDVFQIYTSKVKYSLTAAYRYYTGKDLLGSHRAENDIRATAEVFMAQVRMHTDLGGTVEEISEKLRLAAEEAERKVSYDSQGRLCFNFGKYRGIPVADDVGLARWMLDKDFPEESKRLVREELAKLGVH